jgi:hypothetical protein
MMRYFVPLAGFDIKDRFICDNHHTGSEDKIKIYRSRRLTHLAHRQDNYTSAGIYY